ncbi:ABC transporter permease [Pseudonocardia sp. N23]|uniref:ABC transporter permease n=1 Tax=Pseudonocardia sp. N23 TaxID=1987376 RepID=UPI000C02F49F|nr:ABC transporter permease [Pseudonocardia sp. N23]GAY11771.1 hypothetical protein TOK_0154 [Pseudonocardia sp. N23]
MLGTITTEQHPDRPATDPTAGKGSAYPVDVATLIERVRALAAERGGLPTQNRIMTEFRVGRPKAAAALAALTAPDTETTALDSRAGQVDGPGAAAVRHLHSVAADDDEDPALPQATQDADAPDAPAGPVDVAAESTTARAGVDVAPAPVEPPAETPGPVAGWRGRVRAWPLVLIAAGAFVAIWGGWVGLGELAGFGPIRLLPGIADHWVINSAITLPLGVEAYAAYALRVWLAGQTRSRRARLFAARSAVGALVLGALGQVAYHVMTAAGITVAPWWITTFVSVLPVVVLGCGAALTHLLHDGQDDAEVQR